MSSRQIDPALLASIVGKHSYPAILAEFDFDSGTVGVWTGLGELQWDGHTFTGLGNFVSMSAITETQDMIANSLVFNLNGISPDLTAAGLQERVRGRPCRVWLGTAETNVQAGLEDDSGVVGLEEGGYIIMENRTADTPYMLWQGLMNVIRGKVVIPVSELTLSAENILILLRRSRERRYTDADQQAKYPGDKFFEFTPQLQDKEITF